MLSTTYILACVSRDFYRIISLHGNNTRSLLLDDYPHVKYSVIVAGHDEGIGKWCVGLKADTQQQCWESAVTARFCIQG